VRLVPKTSIDATQKDPRLDCQRTSSLKQNSAVWYFYILSTNLQNGEKVCLTQLSKQVFPIYLQPSRVQGGLQIAKMSVEKRQSLSGDERLIDLASDDTTPTNRNLFYESPFRTKISGQVFILKCPSKNNRSKVFHCFG
jgi:hypothetical protein